MEKINPFNLKAKNINFTLAIFVLTVLCCFNVIYFVGVSANPLIQSDAWYFLDANIKKWIAQGFNLSDLFVKRSVIDHAQPLNKFFLYLNYRFFNLDFRFESLIGLFGLFSIIFFFVHRFLIILFTKAVLARNIIAFSMAIMIITSLNATGLYTWSLVTFSFLPLAMAFACAWFTWLFLQNKKVILCLIFLIFSMLLIGDTAAIILWGSLFISIVLILKTKDSTFKNRAIVWLLVSGALVATIFLSINWSFIFTDNNSSIAKTSQLQLTNPMFYVEAIRIIFSAALIHGTHLTNLGESTKTITLIFALPILYFYIKHFVDLLFIKKDITEIDFLVTFMLVYASASIAAIIFGRVSEYGINYLNQPRYLVIYQLIPFSLLIKWAFTENNNTQERYSIHYSILAIFAGTFLLVIQLSVSSTAYRAVPWIWKWHIEQANAISKYADDPTISSGNCTPHSVPICGMPINKRNDLIKTMQARKLNLFNPNFQNKYRLFLDVRTLDQKTAAQ